MSFADALSEKLLIDLKTVEVPKTPMTRGRSNKVTKELSMSPAKRQVFE